MLRFAAIECGDGGVEGCAQCSAPAVPSYKPAEEILSAASSVVDDWDSSAPGPNISLRGPDLTAHPEFSQLLGGLGALKLERFCITTAGSGMRGTEDVAALLEAGITHLRVRILGPNAPTHDSLSGRSGSFQQAMTLAATFVAMCQASGAPHMLCGEIPVCRHNLELLPQTVVALAQAGARSIALDVSEIALTSAARAWIEAASDTGMVSGVWVCTSDGGHVCGDEGLLGRPPVSLVDSGAA